MEKRYILTDQTDVDIILSTLYKHGANRGYILAYDCRDHESHLYFLIQSMENIGFIDVYQVNSDVSLRLTAKGILHYKAIARGKLKTILAIAGAIGTAIGIFMSITDCFR